MYDDIRPWPARASFTVWALKGFQMKITIFGAAGSVGAPAAFYLAAQGLADDIVMIGGKRQNVLKQHVIEKVRSENAP